MPPSPRIAVVAKWSSVPAALVLSSALVWHASYSAFSATADNPTSNWAAGTVALADDDSSTALFSATNLKPGSTGTKCIVVTCHRQARRGQAVRHQPRHHARAEQLPRPDDRRGHWRHLLGLRADELHRLHLR
jgi:hypothetical protein